MLFDTHAHLNDPAFDEDRAELLDTFRDARVGLVLNAGCSLESSKDCIALAERYPWIYASVGTHPGCSSSISTVSTIRRRCSTKTTTCLFWTALPAMRNCWRPTGRCAVTKK